MATAPPRVGFVSLGCPKALVDSERIITELSAQGYAIAPSYQGSDLVIVNTCGFIDDAVRESLDAIGEALAENGRVIVTGCLGVRSSAEGANLVTQAHPKVLAVTGPHATAEVVAHVQTHLPLANELRPKRMASWMQLQTDAAARAAQRPEVVEPLAGIKLTPPHYAYLKISEGCNHRCTFCIIPSMRGDLVSRPIGSVVREAQALFERGVREILVVSQDTSAYGLDLQYRNDFVAGRPLRTRFLELSQALGELAAEHDGWVRFHYVYPYPHVDEVIQQMADARFAGHLLPYIDVPLQHADPVVLKRMKRPASSERNLERIQAWRAMVPNLTIRSTFIAGFPGETEAQFQSLLDFLDEAQLDRVGCFAYSPVAGAAANDLDGAIPQALREERCARLLEQQARISARRLRARLGASERVLVDELVWLVDEDAPEDDPGIPTAIARSSSDAPEIDGVVRVSLTPDQMATVRVGQFLQVRITDTDEHDLEAILSDVAV
jgi:ribosomal protein S12 methylthiotransferase